MDTLAINGIFRCLEISTYFRLAEAVKVRDVEGAADSRGVHATCASLLQTQVVKDLGEAWILQRMG